MTLSPDMDVDKILEGLKENDNLVVKGFETLKGECKGKSSEMKSIIKFAVSKSGSQICMLVLAILLLGKISYDQLAVDLLPDLNNPRLFIELKAGERPPEEIEKQFVKNMESMAIRQSDVIQVSSVIRAGSARITVEYTWKKDMDEAFLDLQKV